MSFSAALMGFGLMLMGASLLGALATWIPEDRKLWLVLAASLYCLGGVFIGATREAN